MSTVGSTHTGQRAWARQRAVLAAGVALCAFASTALVQRGGHDLGYDLALYRRMAASALGGGNPYADPYADFPPLKMLLFAGLERAQAWLGFSALVAAAVAGLGALLLLRGLPPRPTGGAARAGALAALALPPLFLRAWVQPWEDKGVYVALLLALLLVVPDRWRGGRAAPGTPPSRARLLGAGVLVGLVQGYGGAGLLLLPVLVAWPLARRDWRGAALLAGAALGVTALAHVPYWGRWPAGYTRRAARSRLGAPVHVSFFLLWVRAGLPYAPGLPALAAGALAGAAGALFFLRRLGLHAALTLLCAALLLWGPEASYDRVLAATLPLVLLLARPSVARRRVPSSPQRRDASRLVRGVLVLGIILSLAALGAVGGGGDEEQMSALPALLLLWAGPLAAIAATAAGGRRPAPWARLSSDQLTRPRRAPTSSRPAGCPRRSAGRRA